MLAGQQRLHHRPITGKRSLAGQQPVQRAAQAVDVGADVHGAGVAGLLGGHVIHGAEHGMRFGTAPPAQPGQSEIEDLDLVLPARRRLTRPPCPGVEDKEVGRLDVAVDQAVFVGVAQAVGRLADEVAGQRDRQRAVLLHVLFEVLAGHVLHDEVAQPFPALAGHLRLAGVEGQDDVGVVQHGQRLHLAVEALQEHRVVVVLGHHDLEGDRPRMWICSAL